MYQTNKQHNLTAEQIEHLKKLTPQQKIILAKQYENNNIKAMKKNIDEEITKSETSSKKNLIIPELNKLTDYTEINFEINHLKDNLEVLLNEIKSLKSSLTYNKKENNTIFSDLDRFNVQLNDKEQEINSIMELVDTKIDKNNLFHFENKIYEVANKIKNEFELENEKFELKLSTLKNYLKENIIFVKTQQNDILNSNIQLQKKITDEFQNTINSINSKTENTISNIKKDNSKFITSYSNSIKTLTENYSKVNELINQINVLTEENTSNKSEHKHNITELENKISTLSSTVENDIAEKYNTLYHEINNKIDILNDKSKHLDIRQQNFETSNSILEQEIKKMPENIELEIQQKYITLKNEFEIQINEIKQQTENNGDIQEELNATLTLFETLKTNVLDIENKIFVNSDQHNELKTSLKILEADINSIKENLDTNNVSNGLIMNNSMDDVTSNYQQPISNVTENYNSINFEELINNNSDKLIEFETFQKNQNKIFSKHLENLDLANLEFTSKLETLDEKLKESVIKNKKNTQTALRLNLITILGLIAYILYANYLPY